MSATTLGAFLDEFVAQLQARDGLAGVAVYTCPVDPESLGAAGIELADDVSIDVTQASIGTDDIEESYPVNGMVLVTAPYAASTDVVATINAAAKTARDRCEAIMAEIVAALVADSTAGGAVDNVRIANQTYKQGMAPDAALGRVAWCEFVLEVSNVLSPS